METNGLWTRSGSYTCRCCSRGTGEGVSGASHFSELEAEYADDGLSWCAGSVGVRTMYLRGDWLRDFWGEHERLLRGEVRPEGVPPRRRAPVPASAPAAGSLLRICVSAVSSDAMFVGPEGLKGGNGSKEDPNAAALLSPRPLVNASLELSGEGSTWRIVERVLYAVPGRSGDAGAVHGRICVVRISSISSADSAGGSNIMGSGDGGAVAGGTFAGGALG